MSGGGIPFDFSQLLGTRQGGRGGQFSPRVETLVVVA